MLFDITVQNFIKDNVDQAIVEKTLSPELLALVYQHKWFNIWVPKQYGGLELSLTEGCDLLEALSYEDGGLGWTVTLCSGANMFAGFISADDAEDIFTKPNVCWGGSGQISGKAHIHDDHYLLEGVWKYATGAPHLTHFTLNAWVYKDGLQVLNDDGTPKFCSFYVNRSDVLIHYDWDTFGLEVTASHSFSLDGVKVNLNQSFDISPLHKTSDAAVYDYPFDTFAECTLVVNYIGMFRKYLKVLEDHLLVKSQDAAWYSRKGKQQLHDCDLVGQHLDKMRVKLKRCIERIADLPITKEQQMEITTLTKAIVQFIIAETARLFPYAGITGAQRDSLINRAFRNLYTASQHVTLSQ